MPSVDLNAMKRLLGRVPLEAQALLAVAGTGVLGPERPDRLYAMYRAIERFGAMGAAVSLAAIRHGKRTGLIDELGALTFAQMDQRSNALAHALLDQGITSGTGVGILCRNHRGFYDASFAVVKVGARALYLNTDFAAPQAAEVCRREGVEAVIYDEEFVDVVAGVDAPKGRFVAWTDAPDSSDDQTIESLVSNGAISPPPPPARHGKVIILTSGTTGTPKGADRPQPHSLVPVAAIMSRIPFKAGEVNLVASPAFHAWGLGVSLLSLGLGSTLVVRRRFDPEATIDALAEHRCTGISVVPAVLNRLVSLGPERISSADLSSLRIIASSGAQLEAALATRAMDLFGDIVYNLYGSTEVAWATIATPSDLRDAPGCAGRPPLGTTIRVIDDRGQPVPAGDTGRIFVASGMEFGGYTDGGNKETRDGLMSTGDVGHFDANGRLWIDGRDDEMIVSGGENVFPGEVEELLAAHVAVLEAAAIGVDDEQFGQRLKVFVVRRPGYSLAASEVRDYVKANLARYKVPRDVVFLKQLPRNPAGKVIKRDLSKQKATR